jgi:hypothetical protein
MEQDEIEMPVGSEEGKSAGEIISEVREKHRRKKRGQLKGDAWHAAREAKRLAREGSETSSVSQQSAVTPAPPVDKELVRKSVDSLLKAIDGVITRRCYGVAMIVSEEDKLFSQSITAQIQMQQDERELMASLSAEIAVKYSLLGQYAPEILFTIALGGYTVRTLGVFSKLKELGKELARKRKAEKGESLTQAE